MSPLRSSEPLPPLHGLGAHIRTMSSRPDGALFMWLTEDSRLVYWPREDRWAVEADDLDAEVPLDPREVAAAAWQVANLAQAALWAVRNGQPLPHRHRVLEPPDEAMDERWACAVARALRSVTTPTLGVAS